MCYPTRGKSGQNINGYYSKKIIMGVFKFSYHSHIYYLQNNSLFYKLKTIILMGFF